MNKFIKKQNGISLLEVLMVVGIMSVLVTGAAEIFDDWFEKSVNRKVASEMSELQNSAEQYVTLNMDTITGTMIPNAGDTAELDIADMIDRDFLADEYSARNSFGQSLRVLLRNAGNDTVGGTAVEVVTIADDRDGLDSRVADRRLFDAALAGGPELGLISAADLGATCCDGNIQSAYGEWSVELSDFSGLYSRTPDIDLGGYMAAYGRVSANEARDDRLLYRVEVDSRPELNRMMTNLDMNAQNINNVGTLVSDNLTVGRNAIMDGRETSGFASPYVIAVTDNFDGMGNMDITRDGDSKGSLLIEGDDDNGTSDLNVSNNVTLQSANGQAITNFTAVTNAQSFGSASFGTLNAQAGQFTVNNVTSTNTIITGDMNNVGFLQTSEAVSGIQSITANNAVVGVTDVTGANLVVNGNLDSNNNIAVGGNLNAISNLNGSETVEIGNLNNCANGCPPLP